MGKFRILIQSDQFIPLEKFTWMAVYVIMFLNLSLISKAQRCWEFMATCFNIMSQVSHRFKSCLTCQKSPVRCALSEKNYHCKAWFYAQVVNSQWIVNRNSTEIIWSSSWPLAAVHTFVLNITPHNRSGNNPITNNCNYQKYLCSKI